MCLLDLTKWGRHLPRVSQCAILQDGYYEFD